jgi:pectin lyase
MQVEGAKEENGTNIQQWGTSGDTIHDIWKLIDAGNGYYFIVSQIGDGKTFYLNVAGNSSADGANVEIYKSSGGDSQKFMITENSDGSYIIKTKISNNKSAVEVSAYGKGSGDNIQQWSLTGHESQSWIFEPVADPHLKLRSKNNEIVMGKTVVRKEIYKDNDCEHIVVFVK